MAKRVAEADAATETAEPPFARYTGDGTMFIASAPMRDMTRDEWEALDTHTQATCIATGLYLVAGIPPQQEA